VVARKEEKDNKGGASLLRLAEGRLLSKDSCFGIAVCAMCGRRLWGGLARGLAGCADKESGAYKRSGQVAEKRELKRSPG